jgi:geranylgeranyl transferase type-2 subunit alpha
MHGRKRAEYKARFQNPKVLEVLSQKSLQWHRLMEELLQRRQQFLNHGKNTVETDAKVITLELLEKALVVNPDPYWLWQFRRELLQSCSSDGRMSEIDWDNKEASLTQSALLSNPKAYAAWHHRKWCIYQQTIAITNNHKAGEVNQRSRLLSSELALTAEFLKADERNFHCWSYRKYIVRCLLHNNPKYQDIYGEQLANELGRAVVEEEEDIDEETQQKILQDEWDFTSNKIADNFSNFSAWNYRSQLLKHRVFTESDWKEELTLIENGMCTEPDDQSIWWYHGILLESMDPSTRKRLLPQHVELLQELLEETNRSCKWVFFGLLKCNDYSIPYDNTEMVQPTNGTIYQELIRIDPDRRQRYECCMRKLGISMGVEEPHA